MSDKPRPDDKPTPGEIEKQRVEAELELEQEPGMTHLVSELKSIELQVGEHIIKALQHEGTVAVLTAVMPSGSGGGGGQRIASVPLDAELWMSVQELLTKSGEENAADVPCFGFHCVLEDRQKKAEEEEQKPPPDNF